MSKETLEWLNTQTLQGFKAKRGAAWHYDEAAQSDEPNHYDGAIPKEDVTRRLFTPLRLVEGNLTGTYEDIDETGVTVVNINALDRKTIIRLPGSLGPEDPGAILGTFKSGYKFHGYAEWLLDNLDNLSGGGSAISSAGLLKGGAQAWVQAQLDEDSITTPEGVEFRSFLSAVTSCDGSLASTYMRGAQLIVCDNTMTAALAAKDTDKVKIKHTSGSLKHLGSIRETLNILFKTNEDFAAQVAALCATPVTNKQWSAFLDITAPDVDAKGEPKTGAALTFATNKRDALANLWNNDNRVSPWKGNAFGVIQAINTYEHWIKTVRGSTKQERNLSRMVEGDFDALDAGTMANLNKVLATV